VCCGGQPWSSGRGDLLSSSFLAYFPTNSPTATLPIIDKLALSCAILTMSTFTHPLNLLGHSRNPLKPGDLQEDDSPSVTDISNMTIHVCVHFIFACSSSILLVQGNGYQKPRSLGHDRTWTQRQQPLQGRLRQRQHRWLLYDWLRQ
jgi:hypothetical protein